MAAMATLCPEDATLNFIPVECNGSIGFSLAFENYILITIPAAIVILLAPLRLRRVWSGSVKVASPTILHAVKTLSSILFAVFSLAVLVVSTRLDQPWRQSEMAGAALSFLASLVCLTLSHLEHFKSIRPSVLLQLYLMVALVVQAVHLRTVWLRSPNMVLKAISSAQIASCALFLAAESIQKHSILISRARRSPEDVTDLFNRRLLWWLNDLFMVGYRKVLVPTDIFDVDEDMASQEHQREFRLNWLSMTTRKSDRALYWILLRSMKHYFLFPMVPKLLAIGVNLAQPYFIQRLVAYSGDTAAARPNEGPLLVLAGMCLYIFIATFQAWYWQSCNRFQTKLRGTLILAIHEKALRTRPSAAHSPLMLMNVDVEKAVHGLSFQHEYWATALSMAISLYLLHTQIGLSFLSPTILMICLLAFITRNGSQVAPKQKLWSAATQDRVSFITNVIATMRNIKMMGLVRTIQDLGTSLRVNEVNAQREIRKSIYVNLVISQFTFGLSALFLYCAYAIQAHLGGPPLSNANLFSSIAILKLFTTPLFTTIQYIPHLLQALTALTRIQHYLRSEDHIDPRRNVDSKSLEMLMTPGATSQAAAALRNVTAGYTGRPDVLVEANILLKRGQVHIVTGVVGSGKSTLLKALIGEVKLSKGEILVTTADVGYCDQQPWLWNGTIKENIIGQDEYNEGWFRQVVWSCGLNEDLAQFPRAEFTRAGDDGTSLSGGQKNRISLARAIYARRRIFIADDILSGLDNRTEALVFGRVFGPKGLLRKTGATVVLATHSVGWLNYADEVIVMEAGRCEYQGPPQDIPTSFAGLLKQTLHFDDEQDDSSSVKTSLSSPFEDIVEVVAAPRPRRIYLDYFKSFGLQSCLLYILLEIAPVIAKNMQLFVLKWWAQRNSTNPQVLGLWSGLLAGTTLIEIISTACEIWYAFMVMMPRSSLYLHAMQWKALMEVSFASWGLMDNGSIANRFSQDITLVDTRLANSALNATGCFLALLAMMTIILIATPWVGASIPVICAVLYVIQKIYLKTSKQLRIVELEAKAPLCKHFLETSSGVVTIKAFGWTDKNIEKNIQLLERSQSPFYILLSIQQWLQLVLNLVVAGLATVVVAVCVAAADKLDPGYLGLALLNVMDLGEYLGVFIEAWTQFDTSLGAMARIKDFCALMPQEQQGAVNTSDKWLGRGRIEIKDLVASYSATAEPILKNASISIAAGQQVAICGRTGSGKSSLAAALFGLLHIDSGTILIDGQDITQVSQDLLRDKMIALPQDAYFAPGTVRQNLALRKHERATVTDDAMLLALEKVGLFAKFEKLAMASQGQGWITPLDVRLDPAEMLTRGQAQLFAMARTMLSAGQVLVIDEATSGLDAESDRLVQRLLRSEFKGRTVIAIAHRLETIMDFDHVVVMDAGRVVEEGNPVELAARDGGRFAALVKGGRGGG